SSLFSLFSLGLRVTPLSCIAQLRRPFDPSRNSGPQRAHHDRTILEPGHRITSPAEWPRALFAERSGRATGADYANAAAVAERGAGEGWCAEQDRERAVGSRQVGGAEE